MLLRHKAFVFLILFGVLPLLVLGLAARNFAYSLIEKQLKFSANRTMDTMTAFFSGQLRELINFTGEISRNETIKNKLKVLSTENDGETEAALYSEIKKQIVRDEFFTRFLQPFHFIVAAQDGAVFTALTFITGSEAPARYPAVFDILRQLNAEPGYIQVEQVFRAPHVYSPYGGEQIYCVKSIKEGAGNIGYILVGLSVSGFERLFEDYRIDDSTSLFIFSTDGDVLLSLENVYTAGDAKQFMAQFSNADTLQTSDGTGTVIIDGNRIIRDIRYLPLSPDTRMTILSMTPWASVYKDLKKLNVVTFFLLAYSMASLILLIFLIEKQIINPILVLHRTVKQIDAGNFNVHIESKSRDEFGELNRKFNNMVENIKGYIGKIREEEAIKKDLELKILQEQIKPHFTKNTLNTIKLMADLKGAKAVSRALSAFIQILDYSLTGEDSMVPLQYEVVHIEEYLYLCSLRCQHKFDFSVVIDESYRNCLVPKFCLQPVVENSVIHGIMPKTGMGKIDITCGERENKLIIHIRDTGVGIGDNEFAAVMKSLEVDKGNIKNNLESVGLYNVHKRIRLFFGFQFGVEIFRQKTGGTLVDISLPIVRKDGINESTHN